MIGEPLPVSAARSRKVSPYLGASRDSRLFENLTREMDAQRTHCNNRVQISLARRVSLIDGVGGDGGQLAGVQTLLRMIPLPFPAEKRMGASSATTISSTADSGARGKKRLFGGSSGMHSRVVRAVSINH